MCLRVQKSKLEEVRHTKLRMNIFYQKLFYNSISKKFLVVKKTYLVVLTGTKFRRVCVDV